MDDHIVLSYLKSFVSSQPSQKEAAKVLGISPQYLTDLLKGRRNISEEIAGKFGFRAIWVKSLSMEKTPEGARHLCGNCGKVYSGDQCSHCGHARIIRI